MTAEQDLIWVLDDDDSIRWVLERALKKAGHRVQLFASPQELATTLQPFIQTQQPRAAFPAVLITDVRMPGGDGLQVLAKMQEELPAVPVIVMTAHSDLDSAVSAFQGGAFEYLPKPFDLDDAVKVVARALEQRHRFRQPAREEAPIMSELIGEAPAMQDVFRAIGRLSQSSVNVLINGASGTGKELVARALHQHSPRSDRAFIALNMAAIPSDLVESELFGHEKGAFTGATQKRVGRFEQADGGTLFLDEIGDMPLAVQTRLLRVLQEGQFYPVGGHQPKRVDVRIIAATHQNLEKAVTEGQFREDLFHRLNVIRIQLPVLRERASDIPKLAQHFLRQAAKELSVEPKHLSDAAMQALQQAPWPGNVRQLENTCRWLTVMAPGPQIARVDLPADLLNDVAEQQANAPQSSATAPSHWLHGFDQWLQQQLKQGADNIMPSVIDELEQRAIHHALQATGGHKQEAATRLGWGRNTITRKLKSDS